MHLQHIGETTTTIATTTATNMHWLLQCHAPICVVGDLVSYFKTAAAAAAAATSG